MESITKELTSKLEVGQEFTVQEAYSYCKSTDKNHSIRARIYEGVRKGIFKKISRGVFSLIDKDDNSVLLVNGDGRDLSMIEDGSIDCIITDHPYLDVKSNKGGNRSFADYDAFNYSLDDFKEKARVLKDGAFMVEFFAEENANNFDYIYSCKKLAQEAGFNYYATVNWQKGRFVSNTGRKAKNAEQMVFFTKGESRALKLDAKKNLAEAKVNGIDVSGLSSQEIASLLEQNGHVVHRMKGTAAMLPTIFNVENTSKKERIHQAEKPIELFQQLLEYITLEGELVLDQFSGSGNLGIACLQSKRNAILIEKDEVNYKTSLEKFRNYQAVDKTA